MSAPRRATVERKTAETEIRLELALDGTGRADVETGVGFLDHMLVLFARHGLFDLTVRCRGDLEVDQHHTVEDVGICLGSALGQALGDKGGITRFGSAVIPMDEALVTVSLDLSGRAFMVCTLDVERRRIGEFDAELAPEFFRALAGSALMTLHVVQHHGSNAHHIVEAAFKGVGRALDAATRLDERVQGVPSTKGVL